MLHEGSTSRVKILLHEGNMSRVKIQCYMKVARLVLKYYVACR